MPDGPALGASVALTSRRVGLSGVAYWSRAMLCPPLSATSYLMAYQPEAGAVKLADFSPREGVVKSSMMALLSIHSRCGCNDWIQKVLVPAGRKISPLQRNDWLSEGPKLRKPPKEAPKSMTLSKRVVLGDPLKLTRSEERR